jgi:hypothetical protein
MRAEHKLAILKPKGDPVFQPDRLWLDFDTIASRIGESPFLVGATVQAPLIEIRA